MNHHTPLKCLIISLLMEMDILTHSHKFNAKLDCSCSKLEATNKQNSTKILNMMKLQQNRRIGVMVMDYVIKKHMGQRWAKMTRNNRQQRHEHLGGAMMDVRA